MEISGAAVQRAIGVEASTKLSNFILARINLVRAACPFEVASTRQNLALGLPIVVEKNRKNIGTIEATGYTPTAIITAGAARRNYLLEKGLVHAWAWVEAGSMELNADQMIQPVELLEKLNGALQNKFFGMQGAVPGQAYPFIEEVFPFEGFVNYSMRGQRYKQPFILDNREVRLTGQVTACGEPSPTAGNGLNKESMPRVQTGVRYAYAPMRGNNQTTTRGALNSELMTQVIRNMSDINEAVDMYLNAVKNGLYKPMKPAFAPVNLSDTGKISAALMKANIAPLDFVRFSVFALEQAATKKTKSHGGEDVPMSKHAYVGDPKDPSTWHLPIDKPGRVRNALSRINQTHGIPGNKKPGVLNKIRRVAKHEGIDVSDKPTSGQKSWAKKGQAA